MRIILILQKNMALNTCNKLNMAKVVGSGWLSNRCPLLLGKPPVRAVYMLLGENTKRKIHFRNQPVLEMAHLPQEGKMMKKMAKKTGFYVALSLVCRLFGLVMIIGFIVSGCASTSSPSGSFSSRSTTTQEMKQELPVTPAQDFEYIIDNGEITITGYTGASDSVRVPDTINDIPVRKITSFGAGKGILKTIIIPEGVISIGDNVFGGNPKGNGTMTITLSDSVKSLGFFAFQDDMDDMLFIMANLVAPYTAIVTIGANVRLSEDLYPELPGSGSLPIQLDDYYIANGRKAGVYTIQKNSGTWSYSAK
jgi:hypothetical protein